ncbi:hypothetical protein [Bradyrhizobium sp. 2S1]|uniref:hypothetical protein n=1 Tax=Bradyrhizobium sp. 2S1 TaxID=1404429 RepID=UPI001408E021|nr:hypothetical protein [Bradyrhizobium sp. 2S1]MCK7672758.1 hypothetical protein [Bradyrhizobium sp. 2S1]
MGQKKIRKARFLALHPRCCFCGGNERTADIDHQPARALFNGRVGPEDFEFPACAACNQSSRHHENAMAVLVRLRDTRDDLEVYQEDLRKYFTSMGNNFPSLVRPMTSNEKRSFLKDEGVQRPPGYVLSDLKMVTGSDFAIDAIENVFRKLLVALHYKHSGRIAAAGAAVTLVWFTNAYADRAKEIEQFISALNGRGIVKRGNQDLSDQFIFKYGVDHAEEFSAFAFAFRNSLIAMGSVWSSSEAVAKVENLGSNIDATLSSTK